MKSLKKILVFTLVFVMLFSMASCADTGEYQTKEQVSGIVEEAKTALSALITANQTAIVDLTAEYDAKVAELVVESGENANAILELKTAYEAELALLKKADTDNKNATDALNASFAAELKALESEGAANTEAIAALRSEYEAELVKLKQTDGDNDTAIKALDEKYGKEVADLEKADAENRDAIATLRSEYEAELSKLKQADADNDAAIKALGTTYNDKISALEDRVEEINSTISSLTEEFNSRIDYLEENAVTLEAVEEKIKASEETVGESISVVADAINDINNAFEKSYVYGNKYYDIDVTSAEAIARQGYYMAPGGGVTAHSTYNYTEKFPVEPGDTVKITTRFVNEVDKVNDYKQDVNMRMITVFDAEGNACADLGFSDKNGYSFSSYVIPEGGAYVVATYHKAGYVAGTKLPVIVINCKTEDYNLILKDSANSKAFFEAVSNIEKLTAKVAALEASVASLDVEKINNLSSKIDELTAKIEALDVDKLNESIENIKNLDTNNLNIIVSSTIGSPSISATADKLTAGNVIELEDNTVINNKNLTFTCDIDGEFPADGVIRLGHGKTGYGGSYIEITATSIKLYSVASSASLVETKAHGLTLSDYVSVTIDADYGHAVITLMTNDDNMYTYPKGWSGRNGKIFAEVENCEVSNVKMRWYCEDYQKTIWMIGDSYFSATDGSRWTSYLIDNGYSGMLMMSHSGMASARGLTEFQQALQHGTPKYAVWCMGMNNPDSATAINASYLESTEAFLKICEEKGITPILSTIPSTPTMLNSHKNEWVKDWSETTGGRYIDFARAVGGDVYNASLIGKTYTKPDNTTATNKTGYEWYPDMLYADLVHPATPGAKALYVQALVDFPELMKENETTKNR